MSVQRGTELLWQAIYGMPEFVRRCADPVFREKAHTTKIYQGVEEIRKVGAGGNPSPPAPTPSPVPPLPANAARYQNVAVCAQNPLDALHWPGCKIWLTADPNPAYGQWVTRAVGDHLRAEGHEVGVWYVPDQISHSRAREAADILGTDLIVCDVETLERFNLAVEQGVHAGIANLSALADDTTAHAMIAKGEFVIMNEFYWNQSKRRLPDNHNLPVVSLCIAVYNGCSDSQEGDCWEPHVADYIAAGHMWPTVSVYSVNMTSADWTALPRIR